jgi:hypothetical protein
MILPNFQELVMKNLISSDKATIAALADRLK